MKNFLACLFMLFIWLPLYGQYTINNTTATTTISTCGAPASFALEITNTGTSDIANFSIQLSLPSDVVFNWPGVSPGITLNYGTNTNILNVEIASLLSGATATIGYTVQASCNAAPATGVTILFSNTTGVNTNSAFDITSGSTPAGSLIFENSFQFVNGIPSVNWGHLTTTGQIFTRSYKVINNGTSVFSGFINYTDTLDAALKVRGVSLFADLNNNNQFDSGTETLITGFVSATGNIVRAPLAVNGLASGVAVIITDTLEVVSCLDAGGHSRVNISYGCVANQSCLNLTKEDINTSRAAGSADLIMEAAVKVPMCHYGNNYNRSVRLINKGTAPAKIQEVAFRADNIFNLGWTFSVVPYQSVVTTLHNGTTGLYERTTYAFNDVTTNLNYPRYPYAKCITDTVLSYISAFYRNRYLLPGDTITIDWREVTCCPVVPDIKKPQDWNSNDYFYSSFETYYFEECGGERKSAHTFVVENTNPAPNHGFQNTNLDQALLPYQPRLAGGQRTGSGVINNYMGDVTPINVENFNFTNTVDYVPDNSTLQVEIELEGGLTLTQPNASFNGLNGRYNVLIRKSVGANNYDLMPVAAIPNSPDNQASDDLVNEKWTFTFNLNDPVIQNFINDNVPWYDLRTGFESFLKGSQIQYQLRGVCTGLYGTSHFYTSVFLVPGDSTVSCGCRLPISTINKDIFVTCPGCINPGIILGATHLERTNLGEIDNDNDGRPDLAQSLPLIPDKREKLYATVGDTLHLSQALSFYPGDSDNGFDLDDLRARGINLDQLYIVANVPAGVVLLNASYVDASGVLNAADVIQLNDTTVIYNIPESDYGVLPGSGGVVSMGTLQSNFKIINNITNDVEIKQFGIQGLLSDADLDIHTLTSSPVLLDGTCNGRDTCTVCKEYTDCPVPSDCPGGCLSVFYDIVTANTDNFYCEPGSAANFLFVPIIIDPAVGSADGGINGYSDPCLKRVTYYLRLYHNKYNAFPNEYRKYGSNIRLTMNIAPGYEVDSLYMFVNHISSHSSSPFLGRYYESGALNYSVTPHLQEGTNLLCNINMARLTIDPLAYHTNPVAGSTFMHEDERINSVVILNLHADVCGDLSVNGKYSSNPDDYNRLGVFEYPFIDFLDFNVDEKPYPNPNHINFVHFRPKLNLNAIQLGTNALNIGSTNFTTTVRMSNPDLHDRNINKANDGVDVFTFDLDTTYRLNSNYTFVTVQGLPKGFSLASIVKAGSPIVDINNDGIFEIGTVPGGINFEDLALNFTYDCDTSVTNYPVKVIYGWNCDGYPVSLSDITNVCFSDTFTYFLTTVPIKVNVVNSLSPVSATYCQDMRYSALVTSAQNGQVSNFSNIVYLPKGIYYVPGSAKINGNPIADPNIVNASVNTDADTLLWSSVYTPAISNGQNFTLTFDLRANCSYTGGAVQDTIRGITYCGTTKSFALPAVTPDIIISDSQYDSLSVTMNCVNTGGYSTQITVHNESLATRNINVLTVTFPAGVTVNSMGTTAGYVSGPNQLTWTLPALASGANAAFQISYTVSPSLICGTPLKFNAALSGTPYLNCPGDICQFTSILDEDSCSTNVVRPIEVRPVTMICGDGNGCGTLTSLYPGHTGFSWYLSSSLIAGANSSSYVTCTTVDATYYVHSFDAFGCEYIEEFVVDVGFEYAIQDVNWVCGSSSDICVNILALKDVTKPSGTGIIGMDFCLTYPVGVLNPVTTVAPANIGPVVRGTAGISPVIATYMINAHEPGKVRVSIYYTSSAPGNSQFAGTGLVMCVPFRVIGSPSPGSITNAMFGMCEMYESYPLYERPVCWDSSEFNVIYDTQLRGQLTYRTTPIGLRNNPSSTNHSVNEVKASTNCTNVVSTIAPNLNGSFNITLSGGADSLNIRRDIDNLYGATGTGTRLWNYVNSVDTRAAGLITTMNPYECVIITPGCTQYMPNAMDMIAADVNVSDSVRSNDITLIQKRIVGLIKEYPQVWNASGHVSLDWRFIDSPFLSGRTDYTRSALYPYNDFGGHFWRDNVPFVPECLPIRGQCANEPRRTYPGILLGDLINTNSAYSINPHIKSNMMDTLYHYDIDLPAATLSSGNVYKIPVYYTTPSTTPAIGFDLGIDYNELTTDIIGIEESAPVVQSGSNLMWNNYENTEVLTTNYTLSDWGTSGICYYVLAKKKDNKPLNENDITKAYGMINGDWASVSINGKEGSVTNIQNKITLNSMTLQVIPNPVVDMSVINYAFSVEHSSNNIQIMDVLGRTLESYKGLSKNGSIELRSAGLSSGTYFAVMNDGNSGLKKTIVFQIKL